MTFGIRLWGLVAAAALLGACGETEPPLATYFLSGTVTSTTVEASGAWATVRLVPGSSAAMDEPALYLPRCQLNGPSCDYQVNQVLEGQYTVYGLIDLNGDADPADPLPDSGDLVSPGRPLNMMSRTRLDFPDNSWHRLP